MLLRIFAPIIILMIVQLTSLYLYNGFDVFLSVETVFLVTTFYLVSILVIFFSSQTIKIGFSSNNYSIDNRITILVLFISFLFILRPTFILLGLNIKFGGEYVRNLYFSDPSFFDMVYGRGIIATITNYYIVPFLWFYLLLICDSKKKINIYSFYFFLLILVLYNASYSGRFFIYFSLIVLYLKCVISGVSFLGFLKKNSLLFSIFGFASYIILVNRQYEYGGGVSVYSNLLSILEYHIISPFLLSQKIESGVFNSDIYSYPLRVIFQNITLPIYIIFFEGNINDLIYFNHISNILSEATLYAKNSGSYYNAYGSMFYFFYADAGNFSPFYIFFLLGYIFVSSRFIWNKSIRVKYLAFVSLVFYFSLFQAIIFSPGYILLILGLPLFYLFSKSK